VTKYRIEKDSMGEVNVPIEALWGAQTQRAINNFPVSGLTLPRTAIRSLGLIKAALAASNYKLGYLSQDISESIVKAALIVATGNHDNHFPIDIFQTGSGTSSNMNANEVIANLASKILGAKVYPNDHVNMGQSSNDVIPSIIHISATLGIVENLIPSMTHLKDTINIKAETIKDIVKTGRTHLMDAMPVTFAQELSAWSVQIDQNIDRLKESLPRISAIALGGTAVGTGINADIKLAAEVSAWLSENTGINFSSSKNFFEGLSSQDTVVEVSGKIKNYAISINKISNDLRWMNSGPLAGLGEISLPALQPGSSIMPGKVNPVIPESATMAVAQVVGNDTTITVAGQSGNFQLNVMLPVILYNIIQSIQVMSNISLILADKAIKDFTVNKDNIENALARNPILVTALNPLIGYEKGAYIAKKAYQEGRPIIEVAIEETDIGEDELKRLLDPFELTKGGIKS
jgi:fumarate hydratase class II